MSNSLVPVKKNNVKIACNIAKEYIKVKREVLFNNEVEKELVHRWYRNDRTRLEAEAIVSAPPTSFEEEFTEWRIYGHRTLGRVETLLSVIKVCDGDIIYLDLEDALIIDRYLDDTEELIND